MYTLWACWALHGSKIYQEEKITPERLFNMDDRSLSTVQDGQVKIIGARGRKRIGAMTSNERGESVAKVREYTVSNMRETLSDP